VKWDALTIEFLEDALDGTGAAAAGHLDVELVVMFRHCIVGVSGTNDKEGFEP
jgi:hypothetical protein